MSPEPTYDETTIISLKHVGVAETLLDRVRGLAVAAEQWRRFQHDRHALTQHGAVASICGPRWFDKGGEPVCEKHGYLWPTGEEFCNHVRGEWETIGPLVDRIRALEMVVWG